jgi:hypothetical protein
VAAGEFPQTRAVGYKENTADFYGLQRHFWMLAVKGIEPSYSAWEAAALPLSYTRKSSTWLISGPAVCENAPRDMRRLPQRCGFGQRGLVSRGI